MAKVYARDPGAEIRIGNYGTATETTGVEVPPEVAAELVGSAALRVEDDAPAPRLGRKVPKEEKE